MCGDLLVSCILMYPRSSMLLKYTFKIKLYAYMSYLASGITRSPCYADAKHALLISYAHLLSDFICIMI